MGAPGRMVIFVGGMAARVGAVQLGGERVGTASRA
jgi:hypothetical protein